jgi:hypothetical protein
MNARLLNPIAAIQSRIARPVETADSTLTVHEVAFLLKADRRCRVIHALADDAPQSLGELADRLTRDQHERVSSAARKRNYVPLYQTHIPRLAAHEVVTWDEQRDEIDRGPEFATLHHCLTGLEEVLS